MYKHKCDICGSEKSSSYTWYSSYDEAKKKTISHCQSCWDGEYISPSFAAEAVTSEGRRALHWNEIQSRVTTHEGEVLSGSKGESYQRNYSKQYLGRDLGSAHRATRHDVANFERRK